MRYALWKVPPSPPGVCDMDIFWGEAFCSPLSLAAAVPLRTVIVPVLPLAEALCPMFQILLFSQFTAVCVFFLICFENTIPSKEQRQPHVISF